MNPEQVSSSVDSAVLAEARGSAWLIFRLYKLVLSPILHTMSPSRCVFQPTCSEYAYVALTRFGAMRGAWMALQRLLRCHPLSKGGFDPVPASAVAENRLP